MKTPPLLVDSIFLRAFRGVPGEIGPLDLSSPITLIYAPNGTGKTSLIDAVEWLLTGNVERLNQLDGSKRRRIEPEQLRCLTAQDGLEPQVCGSVHLGATLMTLTRDKKEWNVNGNVTKEPELLKMFAPNAVGENVPYQSEPRLRRNWIRGARFLTEATLAALVDTDKDSEEERREIMADMLGIHDLKERSQKFKKYGDTLKNGYKLMALPGISRLEKELKDKREDLEELSSISLAHQSEAGSSAHGVVNGALHDAVSGLSSLGVQVTLMDDEDPAGTIASVSAALTSESERSQNNKESLNKILARWMEIDNIQAELNKRKMEQKNLSGHVMALEGLIPSLKAKADTLEQSIEQYSGTRKRIVDAHNEFTFSVRKFLDKVTIIQDSEIPSVTTASITTFETLPETAWDAKKFQDLNGELLQIREALDDFLTNTRRLEAARLKCVELSKMSANESTLLDLKEDILQRDKRYQAMKTSHVAISGPVESIRLAVQRYMANKEPGSDCPACGHHWESNKALKAALNRTTDEVPENIRQLSDELLKAEQSLTTAKFALSQIEATLEDHSKVEAEIRSYETALNTFIKRVDTLVHNWGWEPPANDIQAILISVDHRIAFGTTLVALLGSLRSLSRLDKKLKTPDIPVSSLLGHYNLLTSKHNQDIDSKLSDINNELSELNLQYSEKVNELESKSASLTTVRGRIDELLPLAEEFDHAWKMVNGDATRSDETLSSVRKRIERQERTVAEARRHLIAAESAHKSIENERRTKKLRAEIDGLNKKIKRLALRRKQANQAAEALDRLANDYIHNQFEQLSEVFWPIFWRLQANEFYESIRLGPPETPLRWTAHALGKNFDPTRHFSMGQRQDFALAIFLARARSLGGTFFLDEPITHLDDLNRVALLDLFRLLAVEQKGQSRFVITTASKALVRHMQEKFANTSNDNGSQLMRVYGLDGSPRVGVKVEEL